MKTISCDSFAAFVDGEDPEARPIPETLMRHLDACPVCQERYPELVELYALAEEGASVFEAFGLDRGGTSPSIRPASSGRLRVASLVGGALILGGLLFSMNKDDGSGRDGVAPSRVVVTSASEWPRPGVTSSIRVHSENERIVHLPADASPIRARIREGRWSAPLPSRLRSREDS